jgi:hypothetical protein
MSKPPATLPTSDFRQGKFFLFAQSSSGVQLTYYPMGVWATIL